MDRTDQWLATHTFHHEQFADVAALVRLKARQGVRLSLCFPTLNEAATIGMVVDRLRPLRDTVHLLDELAVIDSGSTDRTLELAAAAGADVYRAADILPHLGRYRGKGENLWKAVHQLNGDILLFIDADITNLRPRFVTGLVGPLLHRPDLGYVKAFYDRPAGGADAPWGEGGRVTEILIRPLLSLYFPALADCIQPLAGEYAARRSVLEQLPFPVGYGVELAHLIDVWTAHGLASLAQVDLERRDHRRRSNRELGRMAHALLQVVHRRLWQRGVLAASLECANGLHQFVRRQGHWQREVHRLAEHERPPLVRVAAYRRKRELAGAESVAAAEPAIVVSEG